MTKALPLRRPPAVDRAAALEIARNRANENGWAFPEPAHVTERHRWFSKKPNRFVVETNVTEGGAKAFFTVDRKTGRVLKEALVAVGNKAAAIRIARNRAEENEWAFEEPLEVIEYNGWFRMEPTLYKIRTNFGYYGANAHFTVDAKTGKIFQEGYVPL